MASLSRLLVGSNEGGETEMAVYVDDYRVPWRGRRWSHLIADTPEELHAFAARLGRFQLRFHHKPARPWKDHYDIPEGKRREALGLGAKPITAREMAHMLREKRATTIGVMRSSSGIGGAPVDPTREELTRRARRAWTDADSVLFVCLGNVCRSPFAERLALREVQGRKRVMSSGSYPVAGRRPPDLAVASAQQLGVDLASHRSRVLSPSMLDEADAVFVFDDENHHAVVSQDPAAAERTHLLGALSSAGSALVADPFGGPPSLYQAVYRQIADAIAAGELTRRASA